MAIVEICDKPQPEARSAFIPMLREAIDAMRRRREDLHTLRRLSRLGPRLMRDMGFDPRAVDAALRNTLDDVLAGRIRRDWDCD